MTPDVSCETSPLDGVLDTVIQADCRDILPTLPDACVDAVITDPPAGVKFMGKQWDTPGAFVERLPDTSVTFDRVGGNHHPCSASDRVRTARAEGAQFRSYLTPIFAECLRVLKPSGYALVWALPRTSHWTAMALEGAGFELKDSICHFFGQGFPKGKACLKPAHEIWWLAKAPGPVQPLQIDACRIQSGGTSQDGYGRDGEASAERRYTHSGGTNFAPLPGPRGGASAGRWPPNTLLSHVGGPDGCRPAGVRRIPADKRGQGRPRGTFPHSDDAWGNGRRAYTGAETAGDGTEQQQDYHCVDGCPVAELDRQAGPRTSRNSTAGVHARDIGYHGHGSGSSHPGYHGEEGGPSRFFPTFPGPDPEDAVPFRYQSKASRRDRGEGNTHPTCKSTDLMRWLCRLVTPPGGIILDCFGGSASTAVAAIREGFHFVLVEQDEEYCRIARQRIAAARGERA